MIYYFGRQYDHAIEELQKVVAEKPEFAVAHWGLGLCYEQKGIYEEALAQFERAATLTRRGTNALASLGHAYGRAGRKREAQKVLEELKQRSGQRNIEYQIALVYVGLGRKEQALDWLKKAYEKRSTLLTYLKMDPRFDPLRDHPHFQELLRRMNFPE